VREVGAVAVAAGRGDLEPAAVSAADRLTVLRSRGPVLTKRITRTDAGEWQVEPFCDAKRFTVAEVAVDGLASLARVLTEIARDPRACIIRGRPLPGIDRARCRRLIYPQIYDETGELIPPTFEPAPRRWLALDIDDLPTPEWDADDLARRRSAIRQDWARRNHPDHPQRPAPLWRIDDDGELPPEMDLAGDRDPAPIDPVRDPELAIRAVLVTLPPELGRTSCWWQMTASAGIKPGVRMRLWFWLGRPLSNAEAKRWLVDAPVDRSLYSAVQPHYVACPIFEPPDLDPVPVRSGIWWSAAGNTVIVPGLPEPAPPPRPIVAPMVPQDETALARRAIRYAEAALQAVRTASPGNRHPCLMAVAVRLYSLADRGLLAPAEVTASLLAAAEAPLDPGERMQRTTRRGGRASLNEQALDWARARAAAAPDLPEGLAR
jgi:hypothetical protein